jgi:hypothetical protein
MWFVGDQVPGICRALYACCMWIKKNLISISWIKLFHSFPCKECTIARYLGITLRCEVSCCLPGWVNCNKRQIGNYERSMYFWHMRASLKTNVHFDIVCCSCFWNLSVGSFCKCVNWFSFRKSSIFCSYVSLLIITIVLPLSAFTMIKLFCVSFLRICFVTEFCRLCRILVVVCGVTCLLCIRLWKALT